MAAHAAAQTPQQIRIDPIAAFCQYFALSVPTAKEMQLAMEPCLCGQCAGTRMVANVAMHFKNNVGPEIISRTAAPGPSMKPTNPEAEKMT